MITIAKMVPQKKTKQIALGKTLLRCQEPPFHPMFFHYTTRRLLSWWSLFQKKCYFCKNYIFI